MCLQKWTPNQKLLLTKHGIGGIHGDLILGSIPNQPLCIGKGYVAGRGPIALVVGDDFHFAMLKDAHTRVGGAEVNADCRSL